MHFAIDTGRNLWNGLLWSERIFPAGPFRSSCKGNSYLLRSAIGVASGETMGNS